VRCFGQTCPPPALALWLIADRWLARRALDKRAGWPPGTRTGWQPGCTGLPAVRPAWWWRKSRAVRTFGH